jgi:hypothetical protein
LSELLEINRPLGIRARVQVLRHGKYFPTSDDLGRQPRGIFLKAKTTVAKRGMCVGNQMALAIKLEKMALGHQDKKKFVPLEFHSQTKEERQISDQQMGPPI